MSELPKLPSIEEVRAMAIDKGPIYEPDELVCTLTLDTKQAWVLFMLLAPYREVEHSYWDFYRAAWDVRRRLAEALGYEQEGR